MSRETEATYRESLAGLDETTASDLLRIVLAVLGAELRRWVLGRQSIDEVKQNLDAALSLLLTYRDPTSVDATEAAPFAT
jgi:hypothetical protein